MAVIGDVVASREAESRAEVHTALQRALEHSQRLVPAVQEFGATVGDEFQAVFDSIADAMCAILVVRLALPIPLDVRAGIGVGAVADVGQGRYGRIQDGPGWWAARAAIDEAESRSRRVPELRTWLEGDPMAQAHLLTRDAIVTAFDDRKRRIALGLIEGRTQRELAEREGISASAVSQLVRGSGMAALLASVRVLTGGDSE